MIRPAPFFFAALALGACVPACVAPEDPALLDEPDDLGEDDVALALTEQASTAARPSTHQRPTDHGPIAFGVPASAAITPTDSFHAWTLTLSGPAALSISTGPAARRQRAVDTVLYLYRRGPTGWGRYLARNDDARGTSWSALSRRLDGGEYRVLVKGKDASARGTARVRVDCDGGGCAPAPACVFGETFHDLESQAALRVTSRRVLDASTPLTALDQRRVVRAVQQSSHTDVTTPAEAFAKVDQGEINQLYVYEPAAARTFVVLEYGAGDNSYGAYFTGLGDGPDDGLVARIHDGDVLDCAVTAQVCLLGETYPALRQSPGFRAQGARRVTEPGQVRGVEADQIVRAAQEAYDVVDVAGALEAVDDNEINLARYVHLATGAVFDAVEYGAGDNSYGAVFESGSVQRAAAIHDGDFYGCARFEGQTAH